MKLTQTTDINKAKALKDAVFGFTYRWDYEIRKYQMEEVTSDFKSLYGHSIEKIKEKAELLEEFIARSPKWEGGTTYRGMCISKRQLDELLEKLKSEEGAGMLGSSSWSTQLNTSKVFAQMKYNEPISEYEYRTQKVVLYSRKQKNASSIQYLSKYFGEAEVLSSEKNRYEFVGITSKKGYIYIEVKPK